MKYIVFAIMNTTDDEIIIDRVIDFSWRNEVKKSFTIHSMTEMITGNAALIIHLPLHETISTMVFLCSPPAGISSH